MNEEFLKHCEARAFDLDPIQLDPVLVNMYKLVKELTNHIRGEQKREKEAFEAGREQHLVNTPITRHHYIDGEHRLIDSKVELERPKYPTFEDYLNSIK